MKRFITILVLMLAAVSMTYAIDMSAGAGAKINLNSLYSTETDGVDTLKTTDSNFFIAPEVFFDATYIEASIGYSLFLSGSFKAELNGVSLVEADYADMGIGSISNLTFGIAGKYPITLGGVILFPLVGIDYDLNLTIKDPDGNDLREFMTDDEIADFNNFWLKGGVGADIKVSDVLFVRPKLILGFQFLTDEQKQAIEDDDALGLDLSIVNMKIDLGVYVGYKF